GQAIATAQTDSSGYYNFLIVQAGTFNLVAVGASASFDPVNGVVIGAGKSVVQNFQAGTGTLDITVSDPSTSVAGGVVSLTLVGTADGSVDAGSMVLGADGTATFTDLVAGTYDVSTQLADGDAGQGSVAVAPGATSTL